MLPPQKNCPCRVEPIFSEEDVMQKLENGKEYEVRTVKAGPAGLDSWERMEYIGPWSGRHACHRIDYRGPHQTFYADDDGIRPVRRTAKEIAEAVDRSAYGTDGAYFHAVATRLNAIREYAWEHHGVEIDG